MSKIVYIFAPTLELLVFVDLLAVGNIKPAAFLSVSPIQAVSETKMAQPKMSG